MKKIQNQKKVYKSVSGHGVDVASQRADDLDRLCVQHIEGKSGAHILDLGAGLGGQSMRMVQAGAQVAAVDNHDFAEYFSELRAKNALDKTQLSFVKADIKNLPEALAKYEFTDVIFQRAIHFVTYPAAAAVLVYLHEKIEDTLFISVTGLASAIGAKYADAKQSVVHRFCTLHPEHAQIFSITEPVCLYTKEEFIFLLEKSGWQVERCWESAFGNIKAVCTHKTV